MCTWHYVMIHAQTRCFECTVARSQQVRQHAEHVGFVTVAVVVHRRLVDAVDRAADAAGP
eukprot:m.1334512 g.1334512  ORF g.1334512 m.1334512 type:complete len:60 (+) comp24874_c0_seq5:1892-2071(+)